VSRIEELVDLLIRKIMSRLPFSSGGTVAPKITLEEEMMREHGDSKAEFTSWLLDLIPLVLTPWVYEAENAC
jgi:hypothetical protein